MGIFADIPGSVSVHYRDMARTLSLLAVGTLLAGCVAPLVLYEDGALVVIPHEVSDAGHIVVETTVDGQGPFRFIIDTGASISVLYENARASAGIDTLGGTQVHVLGMTGSGYFPVANSVQLGVGRETWIAERVALLPDTATTDTRIGGILGIDFLSRYAIHYSRTDEVLRFYPRELVAARSYAGWHSVPLYEMNVSDGNVSVFAFDVYIDGYRVPTVLDLGANVNLMNRRAARMLGVPARMTRHVPRPHIKGITGRVTVTTELIVWRLQIGKMHWRHRVFFVGDFPIFDLLDISSKPVAVAGTDLFRDRDFIIDFERGRMLVRRSE